MLVVDLLTTVGQLASAITQKTKELDKLKAEYEAKIQILDKYIAKVTENSPETDSPNKTEAADLLQKELRCQNCSHLIYSLNEQSDYVLVPKRVALEKGAQVPKLLQSLEQLQLGSESANPTPPPQNSRPSQPRNKKQHAKLKRTCSYCDEPGHTRARCLARLNGEPPKAQSQ